MSSAEPEDFSNLLLERFQLPKQRIRILEYLGGGGAGHVFKVRIGNDIYALKMASMN